MSSLLASVLQLTHSSRPQDGCTAAYILRLLLNIPAFTGILRTQLIRITTSTAAAAAAAADDDDHDDHDHDDHDHDDHDHDDDGYYLCIRLLLKLLHRQLDVATMNLLQVRKVSFHYNYYF